jgi:hypothetical protein
LVPSGPAWQYAMFIFAAPGALTLMLYALPAATLSQLTPSIVTWTWPQSGSPLQLPGARSV